MPNDNNKNLILLIIALVLFALLVLTGCAKIEVTPPTAQPRTADRLSASMGAGDWLVRRA
jgi:hypothetical protein